MAPKKEKLVKKEKFCQVLLRQKRKMWYKNITGKGSVISDSTEILKTIYKYFEPGWCRSVFEG